MIGKTNAGAGGSGVAMIHVYYKTGTTCSCTNGVISLNSDNSGEYVFLLPKIGDWTVTGTSSSDITKSITVTVARGESKLITLDTLIPPSDRTTYQEVEYLNVIGNTASVPLGIYCGTGIWQYEIEEFTLNEVTSGVLAWNTIGTADGSGMRMKVATPSLLYESYSASPTADLIIGVSQKITLTFKHCRSGHSFTSPYATMHINDIEVARITSTTMLDSKEIYVGWNNDDNGRSSVHAKYGRIIIRHKETEAAEYDIVGDFIPCIERPATSGTDGLPGYFDLVTNTFHQAKQKTNTGKTEVLGVIIAGPAIGT